MIIVFVAYTLPLRLPKLGGLKAQSGRFPSKIALRFKKICYKVTLYENCQRQSCGIHWHPCKNQL